MAQPLGLLEVALVAVKSSVVFLSELRWANGRRVCFAILRDFDVNIEPVFFGND